MLYMVIEHFAPGAAAEIHRRVRERGRLLLEYLDRWVDLDYGCFQLMRTEDPSLFDAWAAEWRDLGRIEVVPVPTAAEASRYMAERA